MLAQKRRLKVLERTPDYDRDPHWEAEVAQLRRELAGGAPAEARPAPADGRPQAAAALPARASEPPPSPDAGVKKLAPASGLARLSLALSLFTDFNSRTEFGLPPLLLSVAVASVLPHLQAVRVVLAMHILLCFHFCFVRGQPKDVLRNASIYFVRDYIPCAATTILTVAACGNGLRLEG
ncbi:hypothetical protein DIPPA_17081 [Diplonema papillatum]|nr:hypothetical protein DIPPA_17081 [Diplonema papillatum]